MKILIVVFLFSFSSFSKSEVIYRLKGQERSYSDSIKIEITMYGNQQNFLLKSSQFCLEIDTTVFSIKEIKILESYGLEVLNSNPRASIFVFAVLIPPDTSIFIPESGRKISGIKITGKRKVGIPALKWRDRPTNNPVTKIFSILGEVTNPNFHSFFYTTSISSNSVAETFSLSQNYPNPFNSATKINFSIPKSGNVTLKVFDMLGKKVATLVNERLDAGNYEADFNASQLSSGTYFYRIETYDYVETKKMMLMK